MTKSNLFRKILIPTMCTLFGISGCNSSVFAMEKHPGVWSKDDERQHLTDLLKEALERSEVEDWRMKYRGEDGYTHGYVADSLMKIDDIITVYKDLVENNCDDLCLVCLKFSKWVIKNTNYGMVFDCGMRYQDDYSGNARGLIMSLNNVLNQLPSRFNNDVSTVNNILVKHKEHLCNLDKTAKPVLSPMGPRDTSKDIETLDNLIEKLKKLKKLKDLIENKEKSKKLKNLKESMKKWKKWKK